MPSTSLHSQQKRHDSLSTRSSTRDASSSLRRHSPNRIKSRPADPQVISSIISSLEAFETTPRLSVQRHNSHTSSRLSSRPRSPNESSASAPSVRFSVSMSPASSPGFGVEYGRHSEAYAGANEDGDDDRDAAMPPTIPTVRSPSALSQHSPRNSSLLSRTASLRPNSFMSRGRSPSPSPLGSSPRPSLVAKTNSEESRIKHRIQESLQTAARAPKNMIKRNSNATLSSIQIQEEEDHAFDGFSIGYAVSPMSEGDEVVTKQLKHPKSKTRLYLDPDDTVEEKYPGSISPNFNSADSDVTLSPTKEMHQQFPPSPISAPASPRVSLTADSIPLRTSSLLQQNKNLATMKKKSQKSKSKKTEHSPFKSPRTEKIPDTSWVDLGEDDETVKRIMELRKKRETRMTEADTASLPADLDTPTKNGDTIVVEDHAPEMQDPGRTPCNRPYVHRAATEPAKAHKVLGFADSTVPKKPNGTLSNSARASPELIRPFAHLSDSKRPLSVHSRPGTGSNSPQLSLDYSYAQAVADLQAPGRETPTIFEDERPSIDGAIPRGIPFRRNSLSAPKGQDARSDTSSLLSPSISQSSTLQGRARSTKKSPQNRWTTVVHPDLPDEFERKRNRRKSMSDARNARLLEEELETQRRDSIADAVSAYLLAPRLNQKLKHPTSGRIISFSEVGDPNGAAVLICVGMGLTRFVTAFYDELATTLRLRLVTLERPGVGGSDPYPQNDRSGPLNWADDVLNVCEHLQIHKFSLLAHSAGAVYALAIALVLPHLVNGKVQLLAPWIPPSQLDAVSHSATSPPPAGALPRSQRFLRVLPTPLLKAANSSFMTAASTSLKPANKRKPSSNGNVSERSPSESPTSPRMTKRPTTANDNRPDIPRRESMMLMDQYMPSTNPMGNFPLKVRGGATEEDSEEEPLKIFLSATATPMDPAFSYASTALNAAEHAERERQIEYTSRLTQRTWEYAIRDSNPATDLLVCLERNRDVGFRYTDVSRPVVITHGAEDKRVPVANVRWLGDQMNRAAMANSIHSHNGGALHPRNSLPRAPTRDTYAADNGLNLGGGCEVRVLEGEGHGLMASPRIMGDVLTEIAREARDAGAMRRE